MTNRDFYLAVTAFQTAPCGSNRSLEHYLLALRQLCLSLDHLPALSGEAFLHVLEAAFTAEAPAFPEEWRTRTIDEQAGGFAGFDATLIRQVVDLRELAESGGLADEQRSFGLDAPSGHRWYNFDPAGYLECAVQGMYGGWDPNDDTGRVLVPGPVAALDAEGNVVDCDPQDLVQPVGEIASVTWDDFREFLFYGQIYE